MAVRAICITALAVAALSVGTAHAASPAGTEPRQVFANYMLTIPTSGGAATVDGYKKEIQQAQAMGVDGFALNAAGWANEPYYKTNASLMFQAAQELGSGFKLFFSADFCCNLQASDVTDMITSYANHPNYYHYQGRPFLSTFIGEGYGRAWWQDNVLNPLRSQGYDVFFIPYFVPMYTHARTETPDYQTLQDEYGYMWQYVTDGFFYFGVAGVPSQLASSTQAYEQLSASSGKPLMAAYSPGFWGRNSPTRRYFEYQGGEGTQTIWNSIIGAAPKPQWVEMVTWNDYTEDHHLAPANASDLAQVFPYYGTLAKTHAGFYELNKYYVQWYKSGVKPAITKDALYYSYRTHRANAVAATDTPVTELHGDVQDNIYVTTMLTAPASLQVTSGGGRRKYSLPAGINQTRVPFAPGSQTMTVTRKGRSVISVSGEPIQSSITKYNFNKTSGYGYSF